MTGPTMDCNVGLVKNGLVKKINFLEIKIHMKVSSDHYIVGDETENILLVSEQNLREDSCYKLIKPGYEDDKLKKNPKFAAVKLQKDIKATILKDDDVKSFTAVLGLEPRKITVNIDNDFDAVEALGVGSIVKEIKLMVVSKSGVIAGKFGTYKIVTCKDIKNQKNSINLYKSLQDQVEVGGIYSFTNLKVSSFKKDDDKFFRMGTTYSSKVITASENFKNEFENAKVLIGDKAAEGNIVGISNLNIYNSCEVCWSKVDNEGFCRKCDKKIDRKKKDFNLVMYFEVDEPHDKENVEKEDDTDEEILSIFCFKSTLAIKDVENMDINEEFLNNILIGNRCQIQYNFDVQSDDKGLRLVKFAML